MVINAIYIDDNKRDLLRYERKFHNDLRICQDFCVNG